MALIYFPLDTVSWMERWRTICVARAISSAAASKEVHAAKRTVLSAAFALRLSAVSAPACPRHALSSWTSINCVQTPVTTGWSVSTTAVSIVYIPHPCRVLSDNYSFVLFQKNSANSILRVWRFGDFLRWVQANCGPCSLDCHSRVLLHHGMVRTSSPTSYLENSPF